ncbi:23S rRNA pseudouridylate synthase B [Achromobacter xylosoxidans]|uniref:23S rRNA pseudouridine(2605) synthase RluB n=4 Tax=Alcaligenes xylosoxydans xylosoxydans TaxID=85698 RepID=UPI0006C603D8|nr:pseudouridine synthase [Achromobacter xylosoxidans]OMG85824.1 23S rRNA pseudouridylate synthase B [Achromobacter xylosoxidans]QQE57142.1 rRNA pseudouridine synthase [Achromobacter xylosoxidans]QQV16782.1 rRNA pseudouridine synthase [Achromobacter xylosoxidans]UXL06857.1 rRNA pseudouridine synthase [Achromobacter xylosoxidans]CUI45432.1 Ribosomal large subunit pseudouridine synthase B [Achromobacter xylosoxidans]
MQDDNPRPDDAVSNGPAEASAGREPAAEGEARGRGRKLRTPFRRRRGDAAAEQAPATEGQAATAGQADAADARGGEQEAEQALSYLETADRMEQRLGKYLNSEAVMPKLHKVLADAGIGSRREMEELIVAGRVSVNGEPAHIGQRVAPNDQVRVNGKPIMRANTKKPPRVILYHKPAGEIVSHDDPGGRASVFARLPKLRTGKWLSVGRLDLNTEGLLIFTTSGDMANRIMHPRYGTEREYAVRVLGEMDEAQRQSLVDGIELEDGVAAFGALDYLGGDGSNRWYRVTLQEGRNREVRRMFEAVGVTVSRLIRTRFGDVVLPRTLRRGRWEELDASLVTALMVQLGLLREDDESGGNRRRSKQPQSHDSALPPGFGTMDRNGMNGARIGRRGKIQGGRAGSAGQAAACPSDPFGTGLMIAGGYANGHPLAGEANGNRKGGKPAGGRGQAGTGGKSGGRGGKAGGGKARGVRAAAAGSAGAPEAAVGAGRKPAGAKPGGKPAGARGGNAGRGNKPAGAGRAGNKAEGARAGGNKGPGAGGKPRAARGGSSPRGDDWQPRGASAHESRLGVMGGRGGRGR